MWELVRLLGEFVTLQVGEVQARLGLKRPEYGQCRVHAGIAAGCGVMTSRGEFHQFSFENVLLG